MISRKYWLIGIAAVVALAAIAAFIFGLRVTERKRDVATSRIYRISNGLPLFPYRMEASVASDALAISPDPDGESDAVNMYYRLREQIDNVRESDREGTEDTERLAEGREETTTEEYAALDAYLERAHDSLVTLRKYAQSGGIFPGQDPPGYAERYQQRRPVITQFVVLLCADARAHARREVSQESIDDVVAALRLVNSLASAPRLSLQEARFHACQMIFQTIQSIAGANPLSAEQASAILAQIPESSGRDAFAAVLISETMRVLGRFRDIRNGESRIESIVPPKDEVWRFIAHVYASPVCRPWLNLDEESYAITMTQVIDSARRPYFSAAADLTACDRDVANLSGWRMVSQAVLKPPSRLIAAQANYEAMRDLMRLGIRIQQYHHQGNPYPSALDVIATEGTPPKDPFSGRDFLYRPSKDGFLLYSVGYNGKDDGGNHDLWQGDIVWHVGGGA